tara:strand:- start:2120 stop:2644 length:525 start_codon:yes stop_codon:yes gene_type:complete
MNTFKSELNSQTEKFSLEFPVDIIKDLSRRLLKSVVRNCYSTVRKKDTLIHKDYNVDSLALIRYIAAEFEFDLSTAEIHFKDGSSVVLDSIDKITNFYLVLENAYWSIRNIKMVATKDGVNYERAIFIPKKQYFLCIKSQPINFINERGSTGIVPADGNESVLTSGGNGGSLRR